MKSREINLTTLQAFREHTVKQGNSRLYHALDLAIAEYLELSDGTMQAHLERYSRAVERSLRGGIMRRTV